MAEGFGIFSLIITLIIGYIIGIIYPDVGEKIKSYFGNSTSNNPISK